MRRPKMRLEWRSLLPLPIIIGIIWLSTVVFPDDVKVLDAGSLIVSGALYFILATMVLLFVFLICCRIATVRTATAITFVASLFVGMLVINIMNQLVNGFCCSDPFVALLISIVIAMLTVSFQVTIHRRH